MKNQTKDLRLEVLLQILDEGYNKRAWHGPNLQGSIRGVKAGEASWRPAVGRHNIWEVVVHAAYWKYVVRRRIQREKRGSFCLPGSNWFLRPVAFSEQAWRKDIHLLAEEHRKLQKAVASLAQSDRRRKRIEIKPKTERLIWGVAFHDVYHAGQIRLLRRLWRQKECADSPA